MTRISDRLLVQRVDDQIVIVNESSGEEITFPVEQGQRVIDALDYLIRAGQPYQSV
jgi:hypothetical protein